MKTIKMLLTAAFAIAIIAGCGDDEKTGAEALIGTWVISAITTDSAGTQVDIFASFPTCQKDNQLIFQDGGSYVEDEGASKCDPLDPQQETGTWTLTSGETLLTIISGTGPDTTAITLTELSEDRIKGTFPQGSSIFTATLTPY